MKDQVSPYAPNAQELAEMARDVEKPKDFTIDVNVQFTPEELLDFGFDAHSERMMKHFDFRHLPDILQSVSKIFARAALDVVKSTQGGPERTVALRNLLLAKDAAVRAKKFPGG